MTLRTLTILICISAAVLAVRAGVIRELVASPSLDSPVFNPDSHYAHTSWPTIHRDSRNSDFVPYSILPTSRIRWTALDGAALIVPPVIGPEGNLYVTSGRGPGTSHLHAFDRNGRLLWESELQSSLSDLDSRAVGGAPVVDQLGDLYVSDSNQIWAFHSNGTVKWVVDLPEPHRPLISCILSREGFVGGITSGGKVVFVHRHDGTLAAPILDLPGGSGPVGPPIPPGTWGGGLMDPDIIPQTYHGFFGFEAEVANTPAVDPTSGRIFVTAAGLQRDEGVLYGIDFRDGEFIIAFQSPHAAGSGTSPSIAPDGSQVYAVGGDRVLVAYDAKTGEIQWRAGSAGSAASPALAPDGTIFTGDRQFVFALDPLDGTTIWKADLSPLAAEYLPRRMWSRDTTVLPVAYVNSVVTVTPSHLLVAVVVGYQIVLPDLGPTPPQPRITLLSAIDIRDGRILSTRQVRDTSEAIISAGSDGRVYFPHCAVLSSIFYYGINPQLPPRLRTMGPPPGGLTVLEPESFREHVSAGIHWVRQLAMVSMQYLDAGDAANAVKGMVMARDQLAASLDSINTDLRESRELGGARVEALRLTLARAALQLRQAEDVLLTDVQQYRMRVNLALGSLEDALLILDRRLYVRMDIAPQTCPNVIDVHPGSKATLELAVFGDRDFDVMDINPNSLTLTRGDGLGGRALPLASARGVVRRTANLNAPVDDELCSCQSMHVDRFDDVVFTFLAAQLVQALDLSAGLDEPLVLKLSGTLLNGTPFHAIDCLMPVVRSLPAPP